MSPIKTLLAGAAMTSLLMVFAIQRLPGDERIEVPAPQMLQESVHKVDRAPVRRIETDRVVAMAEPVPVTTERIRPDPAPAVPALVALPEDALDETGTEPKYKRRVRQARAESNICTRHGKRKVMTRGGRSWRCR